MLALILGLAYAIDPYDTGRSQLFEKPGVRPQGPRTAAASRGRDPAFNSVIIGNSRIQLISPERLNTKVGLNFVQLSIPGSGPREQLVLLDWFLRHRREPAQAVVLGADGSWCTADPELANERPFPFWLFSANIFEYARGMLRFDTLEAVPQRVAFILDSDAKRARPDGYWDYEDEYAAGRAVAGESREAADHSGERGAASFPAADRLRQFLPRLPNDVALIVVFPPAYERAPGRANLGQQACKSALAAAASLHSRTVVIDWRTNRPETRDPALFFDMTHYRQPIAQAIEDDIAAALRSLR